MASQTWQKCRKGQTKYPRTEIVRRERNHVMRIKSPNVRKWKSPCEIRNRHSRLKTLLRDWKKNCHARLEIVRWERKSCFENIDCNSRVSITDKRLKVWRKLVQTIWGIFWTPWVIYCRETLSLCVRLILFATSAYFSLCLGTFTLRTEPLKPRSSADSRLLYPNFWM